MTDPSFTPEADRQLLAVYAERAQAERARDELRAAGVPEAAVRLDDGADTVAALRAEMHEEITRAWVVPNAGVAYPKEGARGLVVTTVVGSLVGLLAAIPLAIPDWGSTYPVRLLVFAVVGVAFGAVIGLVAGPALGARRPGELPAAARGTLLRVAQDSPELRRLLADLGPIRIDEVRGDDLPIATVATEGEDRFVKDTVRDLGVHARDDDHRADAQRSGGRR